MNIKFQNKTFWIIFQQCEPLSRSFQEEKEGNSLSNPDLFPSATITASAEFSTRFTSTLRFVFHPEKLHWSLMAYDEEAATEVFQGGYRKLWIFFQTLGNTIKEYHLLPVVKTVSEKLKIEI